MITSDKTDAIFKAFREFQAEVTAPAKNGKGNYGSYVLLDDLVLLRKELAKHSLSFTQDAVSASEGIGAITTVMHDSGQWFTTEPLILPLEKRTPQGAGGAITYARRYSLGATLGVASETDDDAQAVEDQQTAKKSSRKPAEKAAENRYRELLSLLAKHKDNVASVFALMTEWGVIESTDGWQKLTDAEKREVLDTLAPDAWQELTAKAGA